MSTMILEELFTRAASLDDDQRRIDQSLETILRAELTRSISSVSGWEDTACTLAQIGEFVVRATIMLSQLTNRLVDGDHVRKYTQDRMRDMNYEHELSDMTFMYYMSDKLASLKNIASTLEEAAKQVDKSWKASPKPPRMPTPNVKVEQPNPLTIVPKTIALPAEPTSERIKGPMLQLQPSTGSHHPKPFVRTTGARAHGSQSPLLEDSIQGDLNEKIASLSSRGKGHHTCPLGNNCQKGGIGTDGKLFVFRRNSAFRAHLEKHGRRYKCDIPGCKNKEGFARKDQLQRHKMETVLHGKSDI